MKRNLSRTIYSIKDVEKHLDMIGKRFNKITVVELLKKYGIHVERMQ